MFLFDFSENMGFNFGDVGNDPGFAVGPSVGILLLLGLLDDLVLSFCVENVLGNVTVTGNSLHLEWKVKKCVKIAGAKIVIRIK